MCEAIDIQCNLKLIPKTHSWYVAVKHLSYNIKLTAREVIGNELTWPYSEDVKPTFLKLAKLKRQLNVQLAIIGNQISNNGLVTKRPRSVWFEFSLL